jgi:hypothetical protein
MLGKGDGTFHFFASYGVRGTAGGGPAVTDINGDGKPDVVVATSGTSGGAENGFVSVLIGNGDGTFQLPVDYPSGGIGQNSIAVADVNGDGKLDALVVSCAPKGSFCSPTNEGAVSVLPGTGKGTFQRAVTFGSGGAYANSIAIADVNGDRRADVFVTDLFSDDVGVLLNDGQYPTFTALTSNLSPSIYGQAVTLTATVTSAGPEIPSGTVTFKNGASSIGSPTLTGGIATLTRSKLPAGTLSLTTTYKGDIQSGGSKSSALTQIVTQATTTTTVTSSVNPSLQGQPVTFTAKVTSPTVTAIGTVTFTAGTATLGMIAMSSGKASVTTSALPKGSIKIKATYNGTPNIIGSAASLTQTVN